MQIPRMVDVPPNRFVFVHYHIFKNGGTTIESILAREFGDRYAAVEGPTDGSVLDAKGLEGFLRGHPEVAAVSSHQLRYPKPEVPGWVIFDCCLVRHPLERLFSLYQHFRRANSTDALACLAKRHTPGEFMRHLLDESPNVVSNAQVVQLANAGAFARPARESDLERATATLCEMALPGLVNLFDESLVSAEYFLKPAFPNLKLHYKPENVSEPARFRALEGREDRLAEAWGDEAQADLLRLNQLDLELARRAEGEVRRRLALVPRWQQKLAAFRARNAQFDTRTSMGESEIPAGRVAGSTR